MVGKHEGGGNQRQDVPGLCGLPEVASVREAGTGVLNRCNSLLAQGAWPVESGASRCLADEACAAILMDDPQRGRSISKGCAENPASCPVLHYRLVYGIAAQRDCGSEVVND